MNDMLADAFDDDFDNVDQEGEVVNNHNNVDQEGEVVNNHNDLSSSGYYHHHEPKLHHPKSTHAHVKEKTGTTHIVVGDFGATKSGNDAEKRMGVVHPKSNHAKEETGTTHIVVGDFGDAKSGYDAKKRMGVVMCAIIIVGSIFNFINSNAATMALSYICLIVAIFIAWAIFRGRFFASSYNLNPRAKIYVKLVLICLCIMVSVEFIIDLLRLSKPEEAYIALAVSNVFNVTAAVFSVLFTWDRDYHNHHHDLSTATPPGQPSVHHDQNVGDRNVDNTELGDHNVHHDNHGDHHHGGLCPHIDHHFAGMMYYFIGGVYYFGGLGYLMFKLLKEKEDKED